MPRPIKDLLKSLRESAQADRIIVPGQPRRRNKAWPICITCGREPYAVNLESVSRTRVEIRVKCGHKPYWQMTPQDKVFEDSATIDIPFGADRTEHINLAMKHLRWFDPTRPPK
jgi:hypothetical protein